ncbi:hypothetical protein PL10110_480024 [Planktothrix agardhii]|nr:hypothetical protein PL10110_480024 [Planktothrix agardhii]
MIAALFTYCYMVEFNPAYLLIPEITERGGFEPPEPCGSPDFKSGAFDHSATSPVAHC